MPMLKQHPDAFAIRFCMQFNRRLLQLDLIGEKFDKDLQQECREHFQIFVQTYGNIENLEDCIERYNISWSSEKSELLKKILRKNTRAQDQDDIVLHKNRDNPRPVEETPGRIITSLYAIKKLAGRIRF